MIGAADLWRLAGAGGRACAGMWSFLATRARCRADVELERVRKAGSVKVIEALPAGALYVEADPGGRSMRIEMPAPPRWAAAQRADTVVEGEGRAVEPGELSA